MSTSPSAITTTTTTTTNFKAPPTFSHLLNIHDMLYQFNNDNTNTDQDNDNHQDHLAFLQEATIGVLSQQIHQHNAAKDNDSSPCTPLISDQQHPSAFPQQQAISSTLVETLQQQLQAKDKQLAAKDKQIKAKDKQIKTKDKQLEEKEKQVRLLSEKLFSK